MANTRAQLVTVKQRLRNCEVVLANKPPSRNVDKYAALKVNLEQLEKRLEKKLAEETEAQQPTEEQAES